MKNGKCTKCGSQRIIVVPGGITGLGEAKNNIPIGMVSWAGVTRFVCADCGFSEEWIASRGDIDKVVKEYGA